VQRDGRAKKGADPGHRLVPSWSGTGEIELSGKRERTTVVDLAIMLGLAVAVDVAGFVFAALLSAHTLYVCGYHCFPSPNATLHDARVRLWAGGIAAATTIGITLLARRARPLVAVVQLGLLLALVVHTVPQIERAHAQLRDLQACQYGYKLPCHGVRDLGTP
jgi:hypothetical protein